MIPSVEPKVKVELKNVPETMLWTLYSRALESIRPDSVLPDKKCVEIFQSIDCDFADLFGRPEPYHAIRARCFDQVVNSYLSTSPAGLVIGLGEGLETQCFRCDNGQVRWLSIDLPEAIKVRERFISADLRRQHLASNILDTSWLSSIPNEPVCITVQGLLMYFDEHQVMGLLQAIDNKLTNYTLVFDTIPQWLSRKTQTGWQVSNKFVTPPMPWGVDANQLESKIKIWLSQKVRFQFLEFGYPRGPMKILFALFSHLPWLGSKRVCIAVCQK